MITRLVPWLLMPWLLLWCWHCRIKRLFLVFHKETFQLPTSWWNFIKFKYIFIFPKINSALQELKRSTSDICDVLVIFWMHDNVNVINKYWSYCHYLIRSSASKFECSFACGFCCQHKLNCLNWFLVRLPFLLSMCASHEPLTHWPLGDVAVFSKEWFLKSLYRIVAWTFTVNSSPPNVAFVRQWTG